MNNESATLLVSSCDAYEDLWGPFLTSLYSILSTCINIESDTNNGGTSLAIKRLELRSGGDL